jgi:two-component system, chemotaxis family, protein-glutamate methylesterase/glutaminase
VRVVVIGTSAGGLQALKALLASLPADLNAFVLAVIHIAPSSPGLLPDLLSKAGQLHCVHPSQGEMLQRGRFYLAPPDRHMLVEAQGTIRLSHGPRENRARPAVDPLFRSAALAFGPEAIGVILTGNLDDGTAGLLAVKRSGGTTVIQDPADAAAPSMPRSAARHVEIDHKVPLSKLAPLLVSLCKERPRAERRVMPDRLRIETEIAADETATLADLAKIGDPSIITCPDCHGTLLKIRDEHLLRFRCHTGHAFTAESLRAALNETTEDTIWSAVRALQEGAMLLGHLAQHARDAGQLDEASSLDREAQDKLEQAALVRDSLTLPADRERVPPR